jgi:DNA-binding XRE family transcriptional regulator
VLPNSSSELYPLDLTPLDVPPRSFLYHLEPRAIATPYTESLSGYIARLAQEHFVTPTQLMSKAVIPYAEGQYSAYRSNKLRLVARAVSALGTTADAFVQVLEKATLRTDLRFTTMLMWSNVLPKRELIRPMRAWCSVCYEEWTTADQAVYEPLIWSLAPIKACVKHWQFLSQYCDHCGRANHHLDSCSRPGYCSRCKRWLGKKQGDALAVSMAITNDEAELQTWFTENIGELIAAAPGLLSIPLRTNVAASISDLVRKVSHGRVSDYARLVQVDQMTVHQWLRGKQMPQLEILLRLCKSMQISLKALLSGEIPGTSDASQSYLPMVKEHTGPTGLVCVNWDKAEVQLNTALKEYPPPSFAKVTKRIGCDGSIIRKKYPAISQMIVTNFRNYQHSPLDLVEIKKVLSVALEEAPPPSIGEIIRRLDIKVHRSTVARRFPVECRQIVDRYSATRKKPFDLEGTKAKLLATLEEDPPRPLSVITIDLGIRGSLLTKKLSDLCKVISARYEVYRKEEQCRKTDLITQEVFRIGIDLHSQGIYPSVDRLVCLLTFHAANPVLRNAQRALKRHLGLK